MSYLLVAGKGCVALCIDNMQRVQELSPIELVEMFVTVFCFLKDSSDVSQMLLDDFRTCNGYLFLSEFLIKLESHLFVHWDRVTCFKLEMFIFLK